MRKIWLFLAAFIMVQTISASAQNYLVKYSEGTAPDENIEAVLVNKSLNLYSVFSEKELSVIEEDENVEYIEENGTVSLIEDFPLISLMQVPTDDLYSEQWQIQMIKAQAAWDMETCGNDVRVAVIDSGCCDSDEISPNIIGGYNYVDKNYDYSDANGHGTNVSGIIAAVNDGKGIVGIACKAKLVQLKCFSGKSGSIENVVKAITDAVDVYGCKVINMSFGIAKQSQTIESALSYAVSKGAIPVAAAGNDGTSVLNYPAASDYAIGVGSVDAYKKHSEFSQVNESVYVVAPGERVIGLSCDGTGYNYFQGTSQAAPQVSAAAAIALSADERITFDEFKSLLEKSSDDLGDTGYDVYYGNGLLNIEKIINNLMKKVPFYVSPVYETGGKKSVILKNNTAVTYRICGIWASYGENGALIGKKVAVSLVAGGAKIAVAYDAPDDTSSKFMLWSTMQSMAPVFKVRSAN